MKVSLIFLLITSVACTASPTKKTLHQAMPEHIDPVETGNGAYATDPAQHLNFAFEKLAVSCAAAKGTFDVKSRDCYCPDQVAGEPASFQAIHRIDTVDGVKRRVFDHYECKSLYRLRPASKTDSTFKELFKKSPEALLQDLATIRYNGNGRSLKISAPQDLGQEMLSNLAQFLDSKPLFINIPNGNQKRESININLYDSSDFIGYTKWMGAYDFEDTASLERGGNQVYIWDTENLAHLGVQRPDPTTAQAAPSNNPLVRDLQAGLEVYRQHVLGDDRVEIHEDVRIIDEGCHILCDYYVSFASGERSYLLEKNYARGQAFRQAFYMVQPDGALQAMSLLFGNLQPSAIITEKVTFDAQGNLTVTDEAFTPALESVYSKNVDVIDTSKGFYEKFDSLAKADGPGLRNVVISLDGNTQLEEAWEKDFWLRGPFASRHPDQTGSLMGWMNPTDASKLLEFFFGVFDANWNTDGKHTREVLHDLVKDFKKGEAHVIPTDFGILLDGRHGDELIRLSGSRILSMSAIYYVDESECNRAFASVKSDVLWILGAGNEGKENPKFRCPQRLHRPDTKLVVAAGVNGMLADYSEYGKTYADIAADGTSYLGTHGSSFAAPKVSNVALKIMDRFGDGISNAEVRLAILLGAKVDSANRLKVRSGGYLDQEGALNVAKAIAALPAETRKQLLNRKVDRTSIFQELLTKSGVLSQKDAAAQASFLVESGV